MVNFTENDRREGSDWINRLISIFSVLAWSSFILALIWFHYASPELIPGYAVYKGIEDEFRDEWLKRWTDRLTIQLIICSITSFIAVVINLKRSRRKEDHFHSSLLMLVMISIAAILYLVWVIYPQF
ncbi:hypothetical protein [Catenovulum adriaticum]|uniref:DUF1648 domain-containing protein n=1 Tax=Catenovulum adriaticum TaxID=2984846 RepID=A0ABY7ARJ8_9ALTE|nr:hypothetical protein [Catenovulum sp. TS8]WAJ71397.1 hypothetical protein OLW01_06265 [Catenovulum sp. TS8]